MSFTSSASEIYLTRVGEELVLNEGVNLATKFPPVKRVLVVGGGVTGLTTTWALLDAGYDVTVVSEKWASLSDRITSQIAGALWEWPPAVCGKHTNLISLDNSKRWCLTSYRAWDKLMKTLPVEEHGVRMRVANFFFEQSLNDMPGQLEKMNEIEAAREIQGFLHDPTLVTKHAVNQEAGVVDSYRHLAPVIDTDHYMTWLRYIVSKKGARLVTAKISGDLLAQEDRLLAKYNATAIINCTGLSGYETAADKTVLPLRGALIRVINDGKKFPKVTEALCVSHDDTHGDEAEDIVFIVPRNDRTLILGGLAQPHVHTLDLTINSPEIVRMRERCNAFVPGLENAELDPDPFVQGLRPFRDDNVRVEREQRLRPDGSISHIIHSYGQGGSGFTLSFGCAADVVGLLEELEAEMPYSSRNVITHAHL
ncbi:nucleotide-binding domain-containing protein [Pleurotus eryngii]|uniref:Nucleotide-binding domain-containing protein n=1 Tax=Pleurotus eryngii TaxID=5323 RepID=A0A9P6D9N1_PLEER|nr:nucleotide-binding domain-containing protein [Pleurotus eryngii]